MNSVIMARPACIAALLFCGLALQTAAVQLTFDFNPYTPDNISGTSHVTTTVPGTPVTGNRYAVATEVLTGAVETAGYTYTVGSSIADPGTTPDNIYGSLASTLTVSTTITGAYAGTYSASVNAAYSDGTVSPLFFKNEGVEHGLGLGRGQGGDPTTHELWATDANPGVPQNYITVNVSDLLGRTVFGELRMQSSTNGETYAIYGSSSAPAAFGSAGTYLTSYTNNEAFVSLPSWGSYSYYTVVSSVYAGAGSNDVLFDAIRVTVPEPTSLSLLALAALGVGCRRRRSRP